MLRSLVNLEHFHKIFSFAASANKNSTRIYCRSLSSSARIRTMRNCYFTLNNNERSPLAITSLDGVPRSPTRALPQTALSSFYSTRLKRWTPSITAAGFRKSALKYSSINVCSMEDFWSRRFGTYRGYFVMLLSSILELSFGLAY